MGRQRPTRQTTLSRRRAEHPAIAPRLSRRARRGDACRCRAGRRQPAAARARCRRGRRHRGAVRRTPPAVRRGRAAREASASSPNSPPRTCSATILPHACGSSPPTSARAAAELRAHAPREESFGHVIANPPYHDTDAGTLAPDALKAGAHAMDEGELEAWARFMARMAAPGGVATIIHKAEALGRVLAAFDQRFGAIRDSAALSARRHAGAPHHRAGHQGQPRAAAASAGLRAARRPATASPPQRRTFSAAAAHWPMQAPA